MKETFTATKISPSSKKEKIFTKNAKEKIYALLLRNPEKFTSLIKMMYHMISRMK